MDLVAAVTRGKEFVTRAIETNPGLGRGAGPLNHWATWGGWRRDDAVHPRVLDHLTVVIEAMEMGRLTQNRRGRLPFLRPCSPTGRSGCIGKRPVPPCGSKSTSLSDT